jgi:hypothetical protein
MVRPHNNWDFSLHHVVCCSHVSSHLGHKQQAGIPFSNKPWRDRNQDPFSLKNTAVLQDTNQHREGGDTYGDPHEQDEGEK